MSMNSVVVLLMFVCCFHCMQNINVWVFRGNLKTDEMPIYRFDECYIKFICWYDCRKVEAFHYVCFYVPSVSVGNTVNIPSVRVYFLVFVCQGFEVVYWVDVALVIFSVLQSEVSLWPQLLCEAKHDAYLYSTDILRIWYNLV